MKIFDFTSLRGEVVRNFFQLFRNISTIFFLWCLLPPLRYASVHNTRICNDKSLNLSSSGSNHSSGHGSLNQLSIAGLNASSTDIRENTVRSGHQDIGTLYAPNNVTYPENISINLVNAPDNSTMQCGCGHINCPLCNLMMSLELTDPNVLK